jgi:hypothetical protein
MALDAFFGMLHAELHRTGAIPERSDDQWKEKLAGENEHYRLLRDAAYMLKHGSLDDRKPRLVRRPEQILTMPTSFDAATFDRSAFDTETVWIETETTDHRAGQSASNFDPRIASVDNVTEGSGRSCRRLGSRR